MITYQQLTDAFNLKCDEFEKVIDAVLQKEFDDNPKSKKFNVFYDSIKWNTERKIQWESVLYQKYSTHWNITKNLHGGIECGFIFERR